MAPGKLNYEQTFTEVAQGVFAIEIKPRMGTASFDPVNTNGSQRGGRPMVQILPRRMKNVEITLGQELSPVITDNFVLIPHPKVCDPDKSYRIEFKAEYVNPR